MGYSFRLQANKCKSVLVIEDNPDHWVLMQEALKEAAPDFSVTWCRDSKGTIDQLSEWINTGQTLPYLILLDLYLPTKHAGLKLIRDLHHHHQFNKLVIVVLSASADQDDVNEVYDMGVSSYLVKPGDQIQWVRLFSSLADYWLNAVELPCIGHY